MRFEYEFHDDTGKWFRAHGNEVCSTPHPCAIFLNIHIAYWLDTIQAGSCTACKASKCCQEALHSEFCGHSAAYSEQGMLPIPSIQCPHTG